MTIRNNTAELCGISVHKQTIPTERLPLVAKFYGLRGVTWSAGRNPHGCKSQFFRQNRYFFFQVAPHLCS
jgi:hypothetical protein